MEANKITTPVKFELSDLNEQEALTVKNALCVLATSSEEDRLGDYGWSPPQYQIALAKTLHDKLAGVYY